MELKEIFLRHGIDLSNTEDQNVQRILTELNNEGIKIDINLHLDQLTDLQVYHLGKAFPLIDISQPQFSTDIAHFARIALLEMSQDLVLHKRIIQPKDLIPFFNTFSLSQEGYDFKAAPIAAQNKTILRDCLDEFQRNSKLRKNRRKRILSQIYQDQAFRSSEDLLVVYILKDQPGQFYYWLTNDTATTYTYLQKFIIPDSSAG